MYFLHQHSRAIIANSLPKVPTKGDKPAPVIVKFISLSCRPAGFMAGASGFKITVKGKPSHGAYPWLSVDPILVASQIVVSLQQIVSRNIKLTDNAASKMKIKQTALLTVFVLHDATHLVPARLVRARGV